MEPQPSHSHSRFQNGRKEQRVWNSYPLRKVPGSLKLISPSGFDNADSCTTLWITLKNTEIPFKRVDFMVSEIYLNFKKIIGQDLDIWLYLAAGEAGKCGHFCRWLCGQLRIGTVINLGRKEWWTVSSLCHSEGTQARLLRHLEGLDLILSPPL